MFKIKYLSKLAAILFAVVMLVSCAASNPKPDWVTKPGKHHVGRCGTHVKGLFYQEQCAYKKGLTYIALTKGVTADISANMNVTQSSNGTGTSRGRLKANIKMHGEEIFIKGKIVEKWHDKVKDVFYVLIEEEE